MMTSTADLDSIPETFNALNELRQLRPIRDETDYEQAVSLVDRLAILDGRTQDQEDYLATLTELVGRYDDTYYERDLSHIRPMDSLKYLMDQHHMDTAILAELLHVDPVRVEHILSGHQELSVTQIRILSDHFKVNPGLFL